MYPYLADFDSDGYDDIEAGEEDNFVKWDPVNGIHIPRKPLASIEEDKADAGFIAAPEDNCSTQLFTEGIDPKTFLEADAGSISSREDASLTKSFARYQNGLNIHLKADAELVAIPEDIPLTQTLGDQIGLSILLEAVKAVSENGQDERNDSGYSDMPGLSEKHGDATEGEANVVSNLVRYMSLFVTS